MDRRTPLLVNRYEVATDAALNEAAASAGVRVCMKVKMSDVLNIRSSGLSDEEFSYACKAHFDFVITDAPESVPQFAVEFDGPSHVTDETAMRRDAMKDTIAERLGLRVLRIDSAFLRRHERFTLVGLLVEIWAADRAFAEAQERGEVPHDEPFCYFSVMSTGSRGEWNWVFSIDATARALMVDAFRRGLADTWVPEERYNGWSYEGMPTVEAYATLPLKDGRFVIGNASLKNFGRFGGITATELVCDLAVADLGDRLRQVLKGQSAAQTGVDFAALNARTGNWHRQGSIIGPYSMKLKDGRMTSSTPL